MTDRPRPVRLRSAISHKILRLMGNSDGSAREVVHQRDLRVVMHDGIELLADHWYPSTDPHAPTLLVQSPYGRRGLFGFLNGTAFAHRGFRVVIVSCRGTAGSGGSFDQPFLHEFDDAQATVEWLREQPWFTGQFATIGASYLGYAQLALATTPPPELVGMVLQVTPSSLRNGLYANRALALSTALEWACLVSRNPTAGMRHTAAMLVHRRRVRHASGMAPLLTNYRLATRTRVGFFEEWITHEDPSDVWWRARDATRALQEAQVPVLVQGGWYDLFLEDSVSQFQEIRQRGLPAQLTIGPWTHSSIAGGFGMLSAEAAGWLRAAFVGEPRQPSPHPVRVQMLGTDEWRQFRDWPPPESRMKLWHLHTGAHLLPAPPEASEPSRYTYDPADPTPSVGGAFLGLGAGPKDNKKLERRLDVLTYTTPYLEGDIEIAGTPELTLWFGSDLNDTDVFVRLCDLHPNGRSVNVCDQIVRLSADSAPRPEGGIWPLSIILPPTACNFAAGHRIRLQVSSGAHPRFLRNSGSGEPLATGTSLVVAHQAVYHDAVRPSALKLPVLS